MNLEAIFNFLFSISPWLLVKLFFLIALLLYGFFAGIIVRQVDLMNKILEAKFSPIIYLFALIHLVAVFFLFLLALIIL